MKMNVYQEISQIIKEADGILIGASNGLSIAEGYNIFADDAWFQENMGDFREKYGLRLSLIHIFGLYLKCGKLLRELLAVYKINSVGDFDLMI